MVQDFEQWIGDNEERLKALGISIVVSGPTGDSDKKKIDVDFLAGRLEAAVQLWETGQCLIMLGDWDFERTDSDEDPVAVSHGAFGSREELYRALEILIGRLIEKGE